MEKLQVQITSVLRRGWGIPVREVMGVHVPGRSVQNFPNSIFSSGEDRRCDAIVMPADMAQRLSVFAARHRVMRLGRYNCYSFMRYLGGWGDSATSFQYARYEGPIVDPAKAVKPLRAYLMRQGGRKGVQVHGVISLEDGLSLSVCGDEGPLVIDDLSHIFREYNADTLQEVTGVCFA